MLPDTGRPWRILIVTLIASALSNLDQSLFGYAVPGLMADLHMPLSAVGTMISASFAFAIVSAPLLAALVPRIGAPAVLTLCVAGSAIFVGLQAIAPNVYLFGIVRILSFGISAAIIPVAGAYLASHAAARGRAMFIAIQQCGYPLGWFVASLLVAPLMGAHGWRSTFLIAFAVVPLAGLVYWLLPRAPRLPAAVQTAKTPTDSALRGLLAPDLRRLTITWAVAFFLYGGAIGGTSFYLPTFFQQARGYDMVTATHVVGLSYGIGMIGYLGAALVSELWLSRIATIVTWLMLATVGLLATIWIPTNSQEDTIVFGITTIFFYGASSIMLTGLLEQFPAALRAAAASIAATSCISLGFVVFPIVTAAAVSHFGWYWSLTLVIVPAVFVAGLLTLSLLRTRWSAPQAAIPAR